MTTTQTPITDTEQPTASPAKQRKSAFNELGFQAPIELLHAEIRSLYTADDVPRIIGYSGGKDSTATLQLVWTAIAELPPEQRTKKVYAISTDTMVENPVVAAWVANSLNAMDKSAVEKGLPFKPTLLRPKVEESFWVNLIGRGYPAPRPKFRWCTERLKISPSNRFISQIVTENGEAILCLGARKNESTARTRVLEKNALYRVRDRISPSATLPGCMIYTPVEEWTSDDIWFFLNNCKNPWGASNKELMGMYAGASADVECPLVVDDSSPSCGDSRFGCWVCTLVDKDKSMTAMIQNDVEKEWMMPLLDLRNAMDFRSNSENPDESNDHHLRDFRRMTGAIQIMPNGKPIPGPYTQESRKRWLSELLIAQEYIHKNGPPEMQEFELITMEELQEIRRIWLIDKHELEDSLPRIYREATGTDYPGRPLDDNLVIGAEEMNVLAELCGDDRMHYELSRELLSITRQQRTTSRRAGLHERLEKTFTRHFYDDRQDALSRAQRMAEQRYKLSQDRPQFASAVMEPLACEQEGEA